MNQDSETPVNGKELLRITEKDIAEANQLSLSCPICAGAVEKSSSNSSLLPVFCANCHTLYHKACWEQNDGKCATLGCEHTKCHPYGTETGPTLVLTYSDIPKHVPQTSSPNGRATKLKAQQRKQRDEMKNRDSWRNLLSRILRAFGWR